MKKVLSSLRSLLWCHWAMVRKKGVVILCGAFLFVAWNALLLLFLWGRPPIGRLGRGAAGEPEQAGHPGDPPQAVIPILVIACDRVTVRRSLDKLIQYRPSPELHPIIVSQDCGHADTAKVIGSYGAQVTHLRQPDVSDIRVRPEHRKFQGYYKIARHYHWALNQVFTVLSYDTVVIVEDDLEVAPDFFEYFRALYPILRSDPTLWCVSAWNDNGRDGLVDVGQPGLLYRTDFFPGLGWMLLRDLWAELEPKWPAAFWDDWMRQPDQRGPPPARPRLNSEFVPFTRLDLSYLLRDGYDRRFQSQVYGAPLVKVEELQQGGVLKGEGPFRVQYSSRDSFKTGRRFHGGSSGASANAAGADYGRLRSRERLVAGPTVPLT
ncbi:hypothetical protein ANANG_G00185600 [Anguilla anguilla]|uniref:Alpha-1,3-mannosyl-glycoprotein 2-beta-N-acetylglucosaminyltransferase n=1 Tax=Anguilla anguilla TaxID=7936 RepID=A0A9D3RU79_ANGAN|nr:hypothetical protein ANANG_G00185600 [Anguilla anguilla]